MILTTNSMEMAANSKKLNTLNNSKYIVGIDFYAKKGFKWLVKHAHKYIHNLRLPEAALEEWLDYRLCFLPGHFPALGVYDHTFAVYDHCPG